MRKNITLLLIGWLPALLHGQTIELETRLARAITNKLYEPPGRTEMIEAVTLFKNTLKAQLPDVTLTTEWQELGFDLVEVPIKNESLWLLCEPAGQHEGRGWYLFRTNHHFSTTLQAPHARNDIHTGMIGLRLFLAGDVRLFAASTVTRHRADVAHLDDTYFQASTVAFAESCPTGLLVQLHGFAREKHPGAKADIIASDGTHSPKTWLKDLTQQLDETTPFSVTTYPSDGHQLGGTRNAQGRALRDRACRFVHLELCRASRDRLVNNNHILGPFLECLASTSSQ